LLPSLIAPPAPPRSRDPPQENPPPLGHETSSPPAANPFLATAIPSGCLLDVFVSRLDPVRVENCQLFPPTMYAPFPEALQRLGPLMPLIRSRPTSTFYPPPLAAIPRDSPCKPPKTELLHGARTSFLRFPPLLTPPSQLRISPLSNRTIFSPIVVTRLLHSSAPLPHLDTNRP